MVRLFHVEIVKSSIVQFNITSLNNYNDHIFKCITSNYFTFIFFIFTSFTCSFFIYINSSKIQGRIPKEKRSNFKTLHFIAKTNFGSRLWNRKISNFFVVQDSCQVAQRAVVESSILALKSAFWFVTSSIACCFV